MKILTIINSIVLLYFLLKPLLKRLEFTYVYSWKNKKRGIDLTVWKNEVGSISNEGTAYPLIKWAKFNDK